MNTLYVVAGSVEQRSFRLPASQLYTGPLFSAAITHARYLAAGEANVRILSPRHGLISQQHLIEPYGLEREELDAEARAHLVENIRRELPRRGALPLRIVVLAPDNLLDLFRLACAGTRFESVPIRAPLSGLSLAQQLRWLQAGTWPIEWDLPSPQIQQLSPSENERLGEAAQAAATWWSDLLMSHSPPPEPTLFATALAQELCKTWETVASATRGEWPEDISFSLTFPAPAGPIIQALRAIGLDARDWWKREGHSRRPKVSMRFSMARVSVQSDAEEAVIFV